MLKLILLISSVMSLNAFAAKHSARPLPVSLLAKSLKVAPQVAPPSGGIVYICSDASGEFKMTADLSAGNDKMVSVAEIGSKEGFAENIKGEKKHSFVMNMVNMLDLKKDETLFEMREAGSKEIKMSLKVNPDSAQAQMAQDHEDVKIIKMNAFLTAPSLQMDNEPMSCLQTLWK